MSLPARLKYIVLSLLFVFATINFTKTIINVLHNSRRLADINSEVADLKDQEKSLESELSYKKSDEFVVAEARNKLNMVKKGEEIFAKPVVLGVKNEPNVKRDPTKQGENNAVLWLKLFF